MAYRNLEVSNQGAVRTIVINRPDKLNALDRATINELRIVFTQAQQDDAVRVVVLAGTGDKAFIAGADIRQINQLTPNQAQTFAEAGQALTQQIENLGKPVIARIQGYALGGGLELAMACHLRIASVKAKLGLPEVTLGIMPGFGGSQRLLRLAGRSAALEMALSGKPIDAERAAQLGVINQSVAHDQLDAAVDKLAQHLAQMPPLALRRILDSIIHGSEGTMAQGLAYEARSFALLFTTQDMQEGTRAFLDKRQAEFTGE